MSEVVHLHTYLVETLSEISYLNHERDSVPATSTLPATYLSFIENNFAPFDYYVFDQFAALLVMNPAAVLELLESENPDVFTLKDNLDDNLFTYYLAAVGLVKHKFPNINNDSDLIKFNASVAIEMIRLAFGLMDLVSVPALTLPIMEYVEEIQKSK